MHEFIEDFHSVLDVCGEFTEVCLNAISLLCIINGVVLSFVKAFHRDPSMRKASHTHVYFRMTLGAWLVVALEFQLAADIVGTIISPTLEQLILLGSVALIRTFLNYFLSRELNEEIRLTKEQQSEISQSKT